MAGKKILMLVGDDGEETTSSEVPVSKRCLLAWGHTRARYTPSAPEKKKGARGRARLRGRPDRQREKRGPAFTLDASLDAAAPPLPGRAAGAQ